MSQLKLLLQKVLDAVVVMRRDGTVADWNSCAEVTFGWTREETIGRSMNELIVPPQYREPHRMGLERYLTNGEAHVLDSRLEITALDKEGREFPVELSITETEFEGDVAFIGFLRDISERKAAELALRESEARLAATYNHALVGIAEVDREGRFLQANGQFCRITGYSTEELTQRTFLDITHPDDVPEDKALFERQWAGEIDEYTREKRYIRKDGQAIWIELAASLVRGDGGARSYGVRIVRDISERREAQERQQMLLHELNHRVKNTLAVVQSIAQQTFHDASPQLTQVLSARLATLAGAHDLLVQQQWAPTSINQVIARALQPFVASTNRLSISGDEVLLPPETAVTLALAMHELATNASKYGALSTAEGRVTVEWHADGGRLDLCWEETGGPPVEQPTRRGFGTRLLQGLAREMDGELEIEYRPQGVLCSIAAPLPG